MGTVGVFMELEKIEGFVSPKEFERFLTFIEGLIDENLIKQIQIPKKHDSYNGERWYLTKEKQVWRLIPPDYPFKGLFEPLTSK